MTARHQINPLLTLIFIILSAAACEPPEETGIVRPRPSASASAPTGQGGLGGSVDGNASTEPIVQYVQLQPTSLDLNVPAAEGIPPAGLASTASLTARAILTSGEPDSSGVEWVVDPLRLAVDAAGLVSVKPGAPSGITAITAVSKRNPALKAQAAVTVTRDGMLAIAGLTDDGSSYAQVTLARNGAYWKTQFLGEDALVRLPEGTGYDVQIQRVSHSASVLLGDHTGLAILPNGLTIATASL